MDISRWHARTMALGVVLALLVVAAVAAACLPATPGAPAVTAGPTAALTQAPVAVTAAPTQAPVAATTAPTATTAAAAPVVQAAKLPSLPTGVDSAGNFYEGDPKAPVKMVEFSDFQCPYCGRHTQETAPQINKAYVEPGKVLHVFRHFPLTEIHPNAMPAAKAAYCAGQQNPAFFWAMHDWLFANQAVWSQGSDSAAQFRTQVVGLGGDGAKFDKCVAAAETGAAIQRDIDDGIKQGVQGTPAFFINDWFVNGAQPFDAFKSIIDKALAGQHPAPTPTPLPAGANFYDVDPSRAGLTYDGSPTLGDAKAPIIVLAFEDFKCKDCSGFFKDVLPGLRDKYIKDGQVRVVYAYYPSEGPKAAVAGVCAARQGKFWEFADALYAHQAEWKDGDNAAMATYAKTAGLDEAKFTQCLSDPSAQAQVDNAVSFAKDKLGVPQTPAFLLADIKANKALGAMVGAQPLSEFESKIQAGLNPPQPTPAAGATEAPAATPTTGPTATPSK
jgi:protein-disulfide isomerase